MKKYFIQTFGCQMNIADSEKLNMILLQASLIKTCSIKEADLVILNTCSVRQKGEDRVFGFINNLYKKAKKSGQEITIGITGCMVRKTGLNIKYLEKEIKRNRAKKIEYIKNKEGIFNNDDKLFPRSNKIDFVLRIEEIKYLPFILSHIYGEHIGQDDKYYDYLKTKQLRDNKVVATTIIQTGCDNYCSYCIVPYTRGKEVSRKKEDIIKEIKENIKSGAKEIILVGQNVNSYGKTSSLGKLKTSPLTSSKTSPLDKLKTSPLAPLLQGEENETPFRKLLEEIDKIKGINRLRFTSSNPHDMTKDILDSHFDLKSTCNHLHFALQSGNDDILKKMNRKHNYKKFKNMVDYLRNKDSLFSISTDIIVGFSGETKEAFDDTVKAFKECEFDFAYNARYSPRKGTIAEKIYPDNISDEIKAKRWHILNDLLLENIKKRNKLMIDRVEDVLVYGQKDNKYFGRTRNFKEVFFRGSDKLKIGDIVKIKLLSLDRYVIKGEFIK